MFFLLDKDSTGKPDNDFFQDHPAEFLHCFFFILQNGGLQGGDAVHPDPAVIGDGFGILSLFRPDPSLGDPRSYYVQRHLHGLLPLIRVSSGGGLKMKYQLVFHRVKSRVFFIAPLEQHLFVAISISNFCGNRGI
jgi:hypothetical protein